MITNDDGSAAQLLALQRIRKKLESTRANLPIGATDPAVDAGLVLARVLVDEEIQALNESDDPPESVQVCYQAYQVVGSLLSDVGAFNTDYAVKILDNLSEARLVHQDVLPWPALAFLVQAQDGLPELPIAAFPAVDTEDGNDKFTANQMRDYARAAVASKTAAMPTAWNHTTSELAAIYGEMAAINETPAKDQSEGQRERLKALRAEAVEIGSKRYSLATAQPPKVDAAPQAISDEEIDRIASLTEKAMEDGLSGFLKSWGWQQFARTLVLNLAPFGLRLATPQPAAIVQTKAARDVLAERQRQISVEGWTHEHDDDHTDGALSQAAMTYLDWVHGEYEPGTVPVSWPADWAFAWFKPSDDRRNLIKAGALILAEIERMDRAARGIGTSETAKTGAAAKDSSE